MPIVGLTDENSTFYGDGTPLIGRLYKGDEKEVKQRRDGSEYESFGKDLEHFRVEFEPQFEHLRPQWEKLYGREPKEFGLVYLFGEEVEDVFSNWLEEWNKSMTLLHRCDGETQVKKWSHELKEYMTGRLACQKNDETHACGCVPTGRLDIVLLDFSIATGVYGHFLVTTHSVHDIIYLHGFLSHLKTRGKLQSFRNVPFVFGRGPREISVPEQVKNSQGKYELTGARMKVMKSLLYLHLEPEFFKAQYAPLLEERPQLPAGGQSLDTASVRKALGTGNGDRRISTEEPAAEAPAPPDEPEVVEGEVVEVEHKPETTYDPDALREAVGFLFETEAERDAMIDKLVAGGRAIKATHVIHPTHSTLYASLCVLQQVMWERYRVDIPKVQRIIQSATHSEMKTVRDYVAAYSLRELWGLVRANAEEPETAKA